MTITLHMVGYAIAGVIALIVLTRLIGWRLFVNVAILIATRIIIIKTLVTVADIVKFPQHDLIATSIALIIWAMLAGLFIDKTLLSVPFQKARVTMNVFNGNTKVWKSGYRIIYAWEKPEREIDLLKHIPIVEKGTKENGETYTSSDHTLLYAKWTQLLQPDPANLETYIQFKESDIEAAFRAFTNQHLSDMCGAAKAEYIMANKTLMAKKLADIYGGENNLSDMERKHGVKSLDPVLSDIDQDPEVLRKRQAGIETDAITRSAKAMIDSAIAAKREMIVIDEVTGKAIKIPTMQEALDAVLLSQDGSKVQKQLFKIEGLENIHTLSIGGLHGMGALSDKGNQPKKESKEGKKK